MLTGLVPRRARISAVLPLVLCTPAAWCQQLPSSPPAPAEPLQQVIVTAARAPEPEDQSLFSATVLTRAHIEARKVSSVPNLLADLAGISVDESGGLGQQSSVFIRGADSDHTLLLIDGVRVGSATLGIAPFEIIPLEQIDRIEVVRGPRSTLYGSDAVGGVIQIFTRSAGEAPAAGGV